MPERRLKYLAIILRLGHKFALSCHSENAKKFLHVGSFSSEKYNHLGIYFDRHFTLWFNSTLIIKIYFDLNIDILYVYRYKEPIFS